MFTKHAKLTTEVAELNLGTTTLQKCAAVARRARFQGSQTFASLHSRLESNNEEEEDAELHGFLTSDAMYSASTQDGKLTARVNVTLKVMLTKSVILTKVNVLLS